MKTHHHLLAGATLATALLGFAFPAQAGLLGGSGGLGGSLGGGIGPGLSGTLNGGMNGQGALATPSPKPITDKAQQKTDVVKDKAAAAQDKAAAAQDKAAAKASNPPTPAAHVDGNATADRHGADASGSAQAHR